MIEVEASQQAEQPLSSLSSSSSGSSLRASSSSDVTSSGLTHPRPDFGNNHYPSFAQLLAMELGRAPTESEILKYSTSLDSSLGQESSLDVSRESEPPVQSAIQQAIAFAHTLHLSTMNRLSRDGERVITLHDTTQATPNERMLVLFTALRWG